MSPRPAYVGGDDSEDEIPRYVHHSRGKRHRFVRTSGRSRTPAYDGDDEASDYAAPSGADRDTRRRLSPRRYADNCRKSHRSRGNCSSLSRGRTDNDEVLYYAKYRSPVKDLPIERDLEGIDISKVRKHTRPSRARGPSGYRESYKIKVDEYEDDLPPRTCTRRRDSRQPETYKVQVDEYEDGLPVRSCTDCRESPLSERRSSRYTEDLKPGELPPRSGPCRSSGPSPVDGDVEYESREPRWYCSSRYSTDVGLEPVELHHRSGQRESSRPSRIDEGVEYEIREPRGYRASHAAHDGGPYQDESSRHVGIKSRRTRGTRAAGRCCESVYTGHGRGRDPDDSDDVEA
ncbi:uncharacterized protein BDW70DRAFT_163192 [Aspergillus foveolatus]|uniref:uncharacterized protein n=1 Tax=Aspergillus foveolatus TaxID=210207 RepID=UPI003CCD8DF0